MTSDPLAHRFDGGFFAALRSDPHCRVCDMPRSLHERVTAWTIDTLDEPPGEPAEHHNEDDEPPN